MVARRQFVIGLSSGMAALACLQARAEPQKLNEKDPTAVALKYTPDASKLDGSKDAPFKAGSSCLTCQFYQGKPGSTEGACPLMGGNLVSSHGWCAGFAKKA